MTLLIFKTALRTFATTAWTAQSYNENTEVKVIFHGEGRPGDYEQRVFFQMSIEDFLAKKVGDTIDLR